MLLNHARPLPASCRSLLMKVEVESRPHEYTFRAELSAAVLDVVSLKIGESQLL